MRRRTAALVTAVALLGATGCGSDADSGGESGSGPDKFKVGVIAIVDVAPIYLGVQKGFFTEQRIEPELVPGSGGAAAVPGVVSGQFRFAFGNVVSLLVGRSQGLPLRALAQGSSSTGMQGKDFGGIVVPKDSPIRSAADLGGKSVAVNNLKNIGDTTVRASIRKAGGDPAAVQFVEMPLPDMPAAVANRRVDAAWVVEPFFTIAQDQGARVVASNFVDAAPDLTVAVYFTTEQVATQQADLTRRFTAAITKSLQYAQDHPDEVRAILPSYAKIEPAVAARMTLPAWPQTINRESVQTLADLMQQDGLITEKVEVAELLG
jgi:NitT/TauT family transport system substrate-binding protein